MYRFSYPTEPSESAEGVDTKTLFSSVLIVEDEPAHAVLIRRALAPLVGDIQEVATGGEALRAIESSIYELVLCDLNLPDMPGQEVMRAIREARPNLPLVVMTSSSNLDDAISAMRDGAWDYVLKQAGEDLSGRLSIVIERAAERRRQSLREWAVRTERDAFWAAVYTARDGVAIVSADGVIVFANEAFHTFSRLLSESAQGDAEANIVRAVHTADARIGEQLQLQLQTRSSDYWSTEIRLFESAPKQVGKEKVKPRELHYELALGSVSPGQFGGIAQPQSTPSRRYVLWTRDITTRKEQERFQRDLLSTTSHDLKGPLGAILTLTELLGERPALQAEKDRELIDRVASCARNSISIIDELLSARRIQDGVLVVRQRWLQVHPAIEDVILDYMPVARAKRVTLSFEVSSPELLVFADRVAFGRVLGNLVSNGMKFTPAGGCVAVKAYKRDSSMVISVADTGSGIESKKIHELFERYSRLDAHQEIEGTGLGLFVTKSIVDAHNGSVSVESQLGKGTTFEISFPDGVTPPISPATKP